MCLSVCPESVLWQNGWLDLDDVWGGEWGWSRVWCITWGGDCRRGRGSFELLGVNVGHPIVTNGDFVELFSVVRGCDAALPKLLWNFLLSIDVIIVVSNVYMFLSLMESAFHRLYSPLLRAFRTTVEVVSNVAMQEFWFGGLSPSPRYFLRLFPFISCLLSVFSLLPVHFLTLFR